MNVPAYFDNAMPPVGHTASQVDVRLLRLPMVDQLAADHGTTSFRELAVVGLGWDEDNGDRGWSWGECAALPTRGYTAESAADCYQRLTEAAPVLRGLDIAEIVGLVTTFNRDDPEGQGEQSPIGDMSLTVRAALEMAAVDAAGKIQNRSLADMAGADRTRVPAGATIGLGPVDHLVSSARRLLDAGYRRIKLKIQPGHDVQIITSVLAGLGHGQPVAQWQVDANGSYPQTGVELMVQLAELGVVAIEQPFAVDDDSSAVELRTELDRRDLQCLIVADEAAVDSTAIQQLAGRGSANAVTVKPYRYGGLHGALAVTDLCRRLGLTVAIGGMIESALGRRSLAPLAARAAVSLTGDLSPSSRWLATDPWPDLAVSVADEAQGLVVTVPSEPGVAPSPDIDVLDAVTIQQHATT